MLFFTSPTSRLHDAVVRGDLMQAKQAIQKGAHLNSAEHDADGRTPLHRAALDGRQSMVIALLDAGAEPNVSDAQGKTPLHLASIQGHTDICRLLLAKHAFINAVSATKGTPLNEAISYNHPEVVDLLLSRGAIRTSQNNSLLYEAADMKYLDVCQVLLRHGANGSERNRDGKTPLIRAVEMALNPGNSMQQRNPNGPAQAKTRALIRLLASQTPSLNAGDHNGQTPLHLVAMSPTSPAQTAVMELLLDMGADVNARDRDGNTPLHVAGQHGRKDACKALVKAKADFDVTNTVGDSPLQWVLRHLVTPIQPTGAPITEWKEISAFLHEERRLARMDSRAPTHRMRM